MVASASKVETRFSCDQVADEHLDDPDGQVEPAGHLGDGQLPCA